ncbi:MAG: hypothetical protein K9G58_11605 [Bacteroidales bacterium]|nr:hypothetical protein [Bacteroidales bacterium]MCF8387903.1 hypothetical protein [Bacteroidales bacterium]MCF8398809.1 hypothetical protein [Bacteroidales bacterium]
MKTRVFFSILFIMGIIATNNAFSKDKNDTVCHSMKELRAKIHACLSTKSYDENFKTDTEYQADVYFSIDENEEFKLVSVLAENDDFKAYVIECLEQNPIFVKNCQKNKVYKLPVKFVFIIK